MKSIRAHFQHSAAVCLILGGLLSIGVTLSWGDVKEVTCGAKGPETLKPTGSVDDYMTDLIVLDQCTVVADSDNGGYYFRNVNIASTFDAQGNLIKVAELKFDDIYNIDFYAESIVIENGSKLTAVSTQPGFLPKHRKLDDVLPYQKTLNIHLWGDSGDAGIECYGKESSAIGPCNIPKTVWDSNPTMAEHLEGNQGPPAMKNMPCTPDSKYMGGKDCFYKYEIQDPQDKQAGRKAYFGHKVLAVSYGGSLQLFGSKGVSYIAQPDTCNPSKKGNECNPAFTGKSWARLTKLSLDADTQKSKIQLSNSVDWAVGDQIVITPTDYLPSHMEEAVITKVDSQTGELTLDRKLSWDHNASTFPLPSAPELPDYVGPTSDPNTDLGRAVETRAAVALLSRNIKIVSEGRTPGEKFPATGYYYGGHTIVRQGVASYRVQGVEFYLLGQGGKKGRYPVHFHMLRTTAPETNDSGPVNFLKDCSIHDSMTRWVTVHATEGMYIARNVGEKSIGHGFYLEDATETNNKFYANIGIFARAAINDPTHNPHQVPGILATNQPANPPSAPGDYMPYRSDYNHPTVFWITNGWNDFEYNFAAGAATCGACYWWLPTGNSGPSQYQHWESYASQQIVPTSAPAGYDNNYARAGLSPLYKFVGNSCVAAMSSFQMNAQTADCLGVQPPGDAGRGLSAVESTAPNGPDARFLPTQPFQLYYPVASELHNPTQCDKDDCAGNIKNPPCNTEDTTTGKCAVTHLDRYTTSFNFAQTNFAAIWLRKGWDLVTNSAVTDVQTGGLNFITGGGYTHGDVSLGEWLVSRNNVLIGHTQNPVQNPFAADVGPFNGETKKLGVQCGTSDSNRCEYAEGGVSFNLPAFPGQKLLNIYDGPSHQTNNAYFNITPSYITDCIYGTGNCGGSAVPLARNIGVLYHDDADGQFPVGCYLPNAAIAWKQPNGFYYPPAFHSLNLWFKNVDIRHFVVEPPFKDIEIGATDPFLVNQSAVDDRYCTRNIAMFNSFNHIDRQTVLNDDDGTLTGLVGAYNGAVRPSISVNQDPFFNVAPDTNDKPECLSDLGVLPLQRVGANGTARTSPYEWLTTAIFPDCVGTFCYDPADQLGHWFSDCGNQQCRGVPLYREYLTSDEQLERNKVLPQIRMMGQGNGQRSTLTLNHGAYYLDITQSCDSQGSCIPCAKVKGSQCEEWGPINYFPTTFIAGHTYYVYFLYATSASKQTYDLIPGSDVKAKDLSIQAIYFNPNANTKTPIGPKDTSFIAAEDKVLTDGTNVVSVTLDMSNQGSIFTSIKPKFCTPKSYCSSQGDSCCRILPGGQYDCSDPTKDNFSQNDCYWASKEIDCPVNPNNLNEMQCFGFSFTLPKNPARDVRPPDPLFVDFPTEYFNDVKFANALKVISPDDECKYGLAPAPRQRR